MLRKILTVIMMSIILIELNSCIVTRQRVVTPESSARNFVSITSKTAKKVTLAIPLTIETTNFKDGKCEMNVQLINLLMFKSVLPELFAQFKKRKVDISIIGVPVNFTSMHIIEGLPLKIDERRDYYSKTETFLNHDLTKEMTYTSHETRDYKICKLISKKEYDSNKDNISSLYRWDRVQNVTRDSDGLAIVKQDEKKTFPFHLFELESLKGIPLDFDSSPLNKESFRLTVSNETDGIKNIDFLMTREQETIHESNFKLFLSVVLAGLIPIIFDNSKLVKISMKEKNSGEVFTREIETFHYAWSPAILTFGLLEDDSYAKLMEGDRAAMRELLDEIVSKYIIQ